MARKNVAILSIDGGGVRGVIPAFVLAVLEEYLKVIEKADKGYDVDVRVVDYFDLIAGTSTGSLVAAMLTAPDENGRPRFTAIDIVFAYLEDSQRIFAEGSKYSEQRKQESMERDHEEPGATKPRFLGKGKALVQKLAAYVEVFLLHPIYDGIHLHKSITSRMKDLTLDKTLKPVIIPAYHLNTGRVFIFSSEQAKDLKRECSTEILVSDAVLSSSAAPVFLPSRSVKINNVEHEFSDGGMAANNPSLLALGDSTRYGARPDYSNCLVLSLGTGGSPLQIPTQSGDEKNSRLTWFLPLKGQTPPIFEALMNSISDMVSLYMARIFRGNSNYLRVQEHNLEDDLNIMATDSVEILRRMLKATSEFMDKPQMVTDPDTGRLQETGKSNKTALFEFAVELCREKKRRERHGSTSFRDMK